ncbi:unnamed protein product [Ectocarpus sp. 4 AP-2014]
MSKVRCWDPELSSWTSEGIEEAEWQPAKRAVRVHTTRVGAIAVVQDRARDLSYLSWRLTPIYDPDPLSEGVEGIDDDNGDAIDLSGNSTPEAELQLETPRFVIRLRIRGTKCRLLGPDLPELRGLLNAPSMGAGRLIMELERICLSPRDEDAARAVCFVGDNASNGSSDSGGNTNGGEVGQLGDDPDNESNNSRKGLTVKDRVLEETLCREVASVAAAFEIRSSRWNGTVGEGRAVFEVRETGAFTGGDGDSIDFKTTLMELDEVSDSAHDAPDVGVAPCPVKCALINGGGDGGSGASVGHGGGKSKLDTTRLLAEETHAYLLKCLSMTSCAEATERAQQSCCRFRKAVEQLLRITRPFSFS